MNKEDFLKHVVTRIIQIKKEKKLTYDDMQAAAGLDRTSVIRICSGKVNFSIKSLHQIAEALDVDPKDLLP